MTRADHPTGTDRIAEVAAGLDEEIVVNIQGDEPLIEGPVIDAAVEALVARSRRADVDAWCTRPSPTRSTTRTA